MAEATLKELAELLIAKHALSHSDDDVKRFMERCEEEKPQQTSGRRAATPDDEKKEEGASAMGSSRRT